MKRQPFTEYTSRVITMCVLIALVSVFTVSAQTDVGCRQQQFGRFSEWSAAVNLGAVVNSQDLDFWPAISPNGSSIYFGSARPGAIPAVAPNIQDIWVTRRASLGAPWEAPQNLGPNINSEFRDNSPRLSRDGHWLIFASNRVTGRCFGTSTNEFYVSYRENTEDDFAWEPAVNFGCELSAVGSNSGVTFFQDDDKGVTSMYFTSTRAGSSEIDFDVYVSTRRFHGGFGPPVLVPELSGSITDLGPSIRADGLEMFLKWDGRPPPGPGNLAVATRETTSQPWTTPKPLGPMINSSADNTQPMLSCDGMQNVAPASTCRLREGRRSQYIVSSSAITASFA